MELRRHGNQPSDALSRWLGRHDEDQRGLLALNVLLLGDRQSGRSSVGNALIGGHEFRTGAVSMTTECRRLSRRFPRCFRRQGAESDLLLSVVDTPPCVPRPHAVHELCPEGVHVIAVVVRVDLPQENTHLVQHAELLFGPSWRHHAVVVFTHSDRLKEAELQPAAFLSQAADWLKALAEEAGGGVWFLDNGCDWPSVRGRPLREQMIRLSAKNHHRAARVRTDGSVL
ncbi:GTPase IMAP family member GIMD1-like [Stegastes partitus]|uniref:GTPase IMAP family member GIMD1-like n=1 Tax=Stegastes partitus TaxID=144197 RepID=A0A9Y4KK58_9TELE|nr:PREDICTED: GTPase IMAP family member GIMD1-like [Stegastes partitus]